MGRGRMRCGVALQLLIVFGVAAGAASAASSVRAAGGGPLCNGMAATIVGTNGPDKITGTEGDDVIHMRGGLDSVFALGGDDVICGGPGNDGIVPGEGDDTVLAGDDHDFVALSPGSDVVYGGEGDDTVRDLGGREPGDKGSDQYFMGRGDDDIEVDQGASDVLVRGGAGEDEVGLNLTFEGTVSLDGGLGSDHLGLAMDGFPGYSVTLDLGSRFIEVPNREGPVPLQGEVARFEHLTLGGQIQWTFRGTARSEEIEVYNTGFQGWLRAGDDKVTMTSYHSQFVDGGRGTDEVDVIDFATVPCVRVEVGDCSAP